MTGYIDYQYIDTIDFFSRPDFIILFDEYNEIYI